MWQFHEHYAKQDILEFQAVAAAQGWNGNHSLMLQEYSKEEQPAGTYSEQKQLCHAAGYLHPVEQTETSIKNWIDLLENRYGQNAR